MTGIWQTVWLEPVAKSHITGLRIQSDIDANTLTVGGEASHTGGVLLVEAKVFDNGREVGSGKSIMVSRW